MFKTILGAIIFLFALFLGIQLAAFDTDLAARFSPPADVPEPREYDDVERIPARPSGIRVSYVGVNDSTLRFLVYNGSTEKLSCRGYEGICSSPELLLNGLDASAWVCMNGSSKYEIKPGDTVEMMVAPYDFARVPGKNEKVVVGFKSIDEDDWRDQYFAEPIVLPPAFRNEIRESFSKWDK